MRRIWLIVAFAPGLAAHSRLAQVSGASKNDRTSRSAHFLRRNLCALNAFTPSQKSRLLTAVLCGRDPLFQQWPETAIDPRWQFRRAEVSGEELAKFAAVTRVFGDAIKTMADYVASMEVETRNLASPVAYPRNS